MAMPDRFDEQYLCYPVSFNDKEHMEKGDKILLPSSALDTLARLHVEYPMLFSLSNPAKGMTTHCGVLEFSAEEGRCYVPFWMMNNLLIEAGGLISIKNVSLPKATAVKLQPESVDFLDISNPRAVLEQQLRHYSCVTKGDHICIPYNGRNYHIEIKEVKPANAACIIETDCNVDFDPPKGYEEFLAKQKKEKEAATSGATGAMVLPAPMSGKAVLEDTGPKFTAFSGGGARLDGKALPTGSPAGPGVGRAAALAAAEKRAQSGASAAEGANGVPPPPLALKPGVAPPPPPKRVQHGQFAKRKIQTGVFQGKGNAL